MSRREDGVGLTKDTNHCPLSVHWLSHLAPTGLSANVPNEKQGLDLLFGTHTRGVFLGLIFVMLLHADLHKGLREEGDGERR